MLAAAAPEWQVAEQRSDAIGLGVLALSLLLLVVGPLGVVLLWYMRGRDPQLGIVVPDYITEPPDAAIGTSGSAGKFVKPVNRLPGL